MRNVKSGRIYDVVDKEKQKKLPEHDFSYPKFHITPSSFRFMTAHQEVINGKTHIVNDVDQTVVVNRPKHYVGSNGSVWGSYIMNLRWELPQLLEIKDGPYRYCSLPLRQFCNRVHDCAYYFQDTTMYDDVMSCTTISNCKFRAHELSPLNWPKQQLLAALQKWDENKAVISEEEVVLGNEVKDTVTDVVEILEQIKGDIYSATKEQLWECFVVLLEKIEATQTCIKKLMQSAAN